MGSLIFKNSKNALSPLVGKQSWQIHPFLTLTVKLLRQTTSANIIFDPLKHKAKQLTFSFCTLYCVVQCVKSIATKSSVKTIRNEFIVNVLVPGGKVTVKSLQLHGPQSQSWQGWEDYPAASIILRLCHFRERPSYVQSKTSIYRKTRRKRDK